MAGNKKTCILTGIDFRGEPDENVSPIAREIVRDIVLQEITANEDFRNNLITAILQSPECVKEITRRVLGVKAADVDLLAPGSIADIFRKQDKVVRRGRESKDNK